MIIEQNVMVAMRDGVKLATDVYRPEGEGRWPVLVVRHAYNKDFRFPFPGWEEKPIAINVNLFAERVVEAGYAIVLQDARGRYASEGEFTPFLFEGSDSVDTIAWAGGQPWSTGRVGMFGVSFQAMVQWMVTMERPEGLRTIVPSQSPHAGGLYLYQGGAFMLATALTLVMGSFAPEQVKRRIESGQATVAEMERLKEAMGDFQARFAQLPLSEQLALQGAAPYYFDWLAHPDQDEYWRATLAEEALERVSIPALTIAGWYDLFLRNDLRHYRLMKQRGENRQQHLVIGPWGHGNFMWGYAERRYGEAAVSEQAVNMLTDIQLRWFDRWLKGVDNGVEEEKPLKIFVMGIDEWRQEEDWPLPDTQYRRYYLQSSGDANTAGGGGVLSVTQMARGEEDEYVYDPLKPVPTRSGENIEAKMQGDLGPYDQREIEMREDVLCYSTEPLERPLEVIGPIELVLYVSSDACDTDFTGKLVDVYPDGRAELLTDGILRARYRELLSQPVLMELGRVYELRIDLGATANVFRAGHRIRLEVSSSNFPRYDRNSNSGGDIATEKTEDFVTAVNRVYHNELYPSYLVLPVIEREE